MEKGDYENKGYIKLAKHCNVNRQNCAQIYQKDSGDNIVGN